MTERPSHYISSFLFLALLTGGMFAADYANLGNLQNIPLQASILGIPEEKKNDQESSIQSSFTSETNAPERHLPSALITKDLFTSNPAEITPPVETGNFFRFIQSTTDLLPIIRYSINLLESQDPETKFINVYQIDASTEKESLRQEQILLQLAVLQSQGRYGVEPISPSEFYLFPNPDGPKLKFFATQVGKSVLGLEYNAGLQEPVISHLLKKLRQR